MTRLDSIERRLDGIEPLVWRHLNCWLSDRVLRIVGDPARSTLIDLISRRIRILVDRVAHVRGRLWRA